MHYKLPNKYYFIEKFDQKNIIKQKNTAIIYRNYKKKLNIKEIINIKNICKKNKLKFFLSNHIKIANKLDLDGAYIPSFNKNFRHLSYSLRKNFIFLGSAHNIKEVRIKDLQKCTLIFISSIFKKNSNFLGLYRSNILRHKTKKKVIALGGITQKNIKLLKMLKFYGFAGISYFK